MHSCSANYFILLLNHGELHSRFVLVLLRTPKSRLKQSETAAYPSLRLREDRRPGFDRTVRVQGRAKSRSTPQMQPQRYPAVYDAIRRHATGFTLFPRLLFFILPPRKLWCRGDEACFEDERAKDEEIGGKKPVLRD
jgi:hypothetical protein